jgi:hypothetical protein
MIRKSYSKLLKLDKIKIKIYRNIKKLINLFLKQKSTSSEKLGPKTRKLQSKGK